MSALTEAVKGNAQIIRDASGNPLYAVVPFDEYQALLEADNQVTIPHEVVTLMIEKDISPMAAWRKHRGLSQVQMAEKLGITQGAVAQAEKLGNKPHIETLRSWADVLDCDVAQLTE
ncbi:MAG: helix-turn-helix domain-containing protein [Saccharospirillaceae bacterium]|nr:helix-turn-helix domain-containing protein [Saccharospirillaceae bacterium]MCD8530901.1 helix-turn-helix domain-containing protein [Saccharospirillaceae bacterium]